MCAACVSLLSLFSPRPPSRQQLRAASTLPPGVPGARPGSFPTPPAHPAPAPTVMTCSWWRTGPSVPCTSSLGGSNGPRGSSARPSGVTSATQTAFGREDEGLGSGKPCMCVAQTMDQAMVVVTRRGGGRVRASGFLLEVENAFSSSSSFPLFLSFIPRVHPRHGLLHHPLYPGGHPAPRSTPPRPGRQGTNPHPLLPLPAHRHCCSP